MTYTRHFQLADDYLVHVDAALIGIADPFVRSRYVGFTAISAVTVYELAIKEIFMGFGAKKHKVLGTFVQRHFDRINGQIGRDRIVGTYLPLFGDKYVDRFKRHLESTELRCLRTDSVSVKESYANLLTWRNAFAHEGVIPSSATYEEVKRSYLFGKKLIECLAATMVR